MSLREQLHAYIAELEKRLRWSTMLRGAAVITGSALIATLVLVTIANALAFSHGVSERVFLGECGGRMAPAPRGPNGFGYDPIFIPDRYPDQTMAELTEAQKDEISHRGNAVRDFAWWFLGDRLGLRR